MTNPGWTIFSIRYSLAFYNNYDGICIFCMFANNVIKYYTRGVKGLYYAVARANDVGRSTRTQDIHIGVVVIEYNSRMECNKAHKHIAH